MAMVRTTGLLLLLTCVGPSLGNAADTTLLSMGELVDLELMHHVNSKHTVPGSSLYFRVVEDLAVKGTTVVEAGTIVRGSMVDAKKNKAFGRAGKMGIVLGNLRAVDDTSVPLDAEIERKGRTRYGATAGMALTFGLAGLFTRGRAAFLEKGELFSVRIAADREIDSSAAPATASPDEWDPNAGEVLLEPQKQSYVLKIEKREKVTPVRFTVRDSSGVGELVELELVAVNGMTLPEPVKQESALAFDGWSLLSYCDDGQTELEFRGRTSDGVRVSARAYLTLEIKRKGK